MESTELEQLTALVVQDFDPERTEPVFTEEQLLELLGEQIAYLIEHKLEFLMSLMYRLDVDERKVDYALSPAAEELPHIALAKLVLERQKQRIFTKRHYRQQHPDNWEWSD
jgi:hypothetical protein